MRNQSHILTSNDTRISACTEEVHHNQRTGNPLALPHSYFVTYIVDVLSTQSQISKIANAKPSSSYVQPHRYRGQ